MTQEPFGPVAPVVRFDDIEEGIAKANSRTVWTVVLRVHEFSTNRYKGFQRPRSRYGKH